MITRVVCLTFCCICICNNHVEGIRNTINVSPNVNIKNSAYDKCLLKQWAKDNRLGIWYMRYMPNVRILPNFYRSSNVSFHGTTIRQNTHSLWSQPRKNQRKTRKNRNCREINRRTIVEVIDEEEILEDFSSYLFPRDTCTHSMVPLSRPIFTVTPTFQRAGSFRFVHG